MVHTVFNLSLCAQILTIEYESAKTQKKTIFIDTSLFKGGPWFDTVQVLTFNMKLTHEGHVKKRKHPLLAPDGTKITYEPDYYRFYAKVLF